MPRISVIGGGPGGYAAAFEAAARGAEVTLFEQCRLGGTCLNVGCIPTKTILRSARALRDLARCQDFALSGVPDLSGVHIDIDALRARKDAVVGELVSQLEATARRLKVTVVPGRAYLSSPTTVTVETTAGSGADHPGGEATAAAAASEKAAPTADVPASFESDAVIIATGSEPVVLPALVQPFVWTSDDALALTAIPPEIIIVGGGVIGVEFACAYAAFGSTVHIVELSPALLPGFDARAVRTLTSALKQQGVNLHLGTSVEAVRQQPAGKGTRVVATLDGGSELEADVLLSAVGRAPRTAGFGFEELGLEYDRRALKVNEYFQTNIAGVYAVGDAIGGLMLAHAAEAEGRAAARNVLAALAGTAPTGTVDSRTVPACVYTFPELASVGLQSAAAKEAGYEPISGLVKYTGNGKALVEGETEGYVELVADAQTGLLLGGQIVGAHAVEMIATLAEALSAQMTISDFQQVIFAHPTVSELLHGAVELLATKQEAARR